MKLNGVFWVDLETTGLDPAIHRIYQLSVLYEVGGEITQSLNLYVDCDDAEWEDVALELAQSNPPLDDVDVVSERELYATVHGFMHQFCNPYKKDEKILPAGYNVAFDILFLDALFKKHDDNYLHSFISPMSIDVLGFVAALVGSGKLNLRGLVNCKLETVAKFFGVEFTAQEDGQLQDIIQMHNSLDDIIVTRQLYEILKDHA